MEKKQGNTMIISLILIFVFSSFIMCFCIFNISLNKQTKTLANDLNNNRYIELQAYDFFVENKIENELFYLDDGVIYYKNDKNVKFKVYINNDIFNIRRID